MRPALIVLALAAGCGEFEDPAIVRDLRPLAMTATPPEQVFVVDPAMPVIPEAQDVRVCALVADPERRQLEYRMVVCPPQRDLRCDDLEAPFLVVDDVELSHDPRAVGQVACATIPGGPQLTSIVRYTLENDSLQGFGGVDINVSLRVVPAGAGEDQAVYAGKAIRFSAQVPAERTANTNPAIGELLVQVDRGEGFGDAATLRTGACLDPLDRLTIKVGDTVKVAPRPVEGSEETYVVPTFEGGSRQFTENLSYNWRSTGGGWSRDATGGGRDAAGNPAAISTEWQPPSTNGADVRLVDLWIIQHDERGGASFTEACVAVTP